MSILAINTSVKTNAELIVACRDLGYLSEGIITLDPTYGLGRFWKLWQPRHLLRHDIEADRAPNGPMDFTNLDYENSTFGAVVFDPPYKLNGTGGSHASDDAYGVADSMTWQGRMSLCCHGVIECARVTAPGGHLLIKCQDQVCSGKVRWQTHDFAEIARTNGCELIDMLHLVSYRAQPPGRSQVHARRNYSTLLVTRKIAA